MAGNEYHIPVLLTQSVDVLIGKDVDGVYADATFGGGGHSREILGRLSSKGRLFSFDKDKDALENKLEDKRFTLINNNFRFIHNFVLYHGYKGGIDGIIADLGVSSHQFDTPQRGFSFRFDAPLDMRMNVDTALKASDVVNGYKEDELEKIFSLYGEVAFSQKFASLIVSSRKKAKIMTTSQFNEVLSTLLPPRFEHKILAKIYQALRIEVNGEMRDLEKFLQGACASLKNHGRLVVITYHSLEDRMVKNFIKTGNVAGEYNKDFYGKISTPMCSLLKKPILPPESEISVNTRARSAKLRAAEKLN